jgi:ATP-dependent RNA helicase DDX51/DBP6
MCDALCVCVVQHVRFLVLDEADRLMSNAYQDWIAALREGLAGPQDSQGSIDTQASSSSARLFHKHPKPLQRLLFSATLADNPRKLALLDIRNPQVIRAAMDTRRGKKDAGTSSKASAELADESAMMAVDQGTSSSSGYTLPQTLSELLCISDTETRALDLVCLLYDMCLTDAPATASTAKRAKTVDEEGQSGVHSLQKNKHQHVGLCVRQEDMILIFASSVDATHRLCRLLQLVNGQLGKPSGAVGNKQGDVSIKDKKRKQRSEPHTEHKESEATSATSSFFGGAVAEISSSLRQADRALIMQRAKDGDIKILVCSDQLSRGIDLPNIKVVVNYDTPTVARVYVHRLVVQTLLMVCF